jgi:hypothetical protein
MKGSDPPMTSVDLDSTLATGRSPPCCRGEDPGCGKRQEQLVWDRLARGKGRLRRSGLEPWPAALGAGWFHVYAGLALAGCARAGPASTSHVRLVRFPLVGFRLVSLAGEGSG